MPLDAAQADWLSQASGKTVLAAGAKPGKDDDGKARLKRKLADEDMADQQRKALLIADAMRIIDPLRPALREAFDLQFTDAKGNTKQFQAKDGDLGKTADVYGAGVLSRGGTKPPKKGADPKAREQEIEALKAEANRARYLIEKTGLALLKETTTRSQLDVASGKLFDGPAEPLFTTKEVMDELYTPLVRARILPDGFVPNEFSAVKQMLDGTFALYKKELKDAVDPNSGVAALAKGLITLGKDLAEPIMQAAGADPALAMVLLDGCVALTEASIDLGDKLHSGLYADGIIEFLNAVPGILGTMVGGALNNDDIGTAISNAGSAGTGAITLIITSVKAKKPDVKGFIEFFSSVLSDAIGEISTGNDTGDAAVTMGNDLQKLIAQAAADHCDAFFEAVASGNRKGAHGACKSMCIDIALGVTSLGNDAFGVGTATIDMDDAVSDSVETVQDTVDEVRETISESKKASEEIRKKLEEQADEKFGKLEKKVAESDKQRDADKNDGKKIAKDIQAEMDAEKKEFSDQLRNLNQDTADFQTITKLIAKMQRDRAIVAVAIAIGKGGASIAEHFFPPAAIAAEAIKMAANIAAAVQRAVDLVKFIDESIGAANATSPYLPSIQNFVQNQGEQLTHYSIAIALNGVKIAAAAAATAYPAAAPSVAIISGVQAGAEAVYAFYNATQVRKAWKLTKLALEDPESRLAGLKAVRKNPTLAKYCIAYGATVERDPVAVSMVEACGLKGAVLANKETNAVKVKIFLELKFSEDRKVVGSFTEAPTWSDALPVPALDVAVLTRSYDIISQSPPFVAKERKPIKPATELMAIVRTLRKQRLADNATVDQVSEHLTLAGRAVTALRSDMVEYGEIDKDILSALGDLVDAAENEQEKLASRIINMKVASAQLATAPT